MKESPLPNCQLVSGSLNLGFLLLFNGYISWFLSHRVVSVTLNPGFTLESPRKEKKKKKRVCLCVCLKAPPSEMLIKMAWSGAQAMWEELFGELVL